MTAAAVPARRWAYIVLGDMRVCAVWAAITFGAALLLLAGGGSLHRYQFMPVLSGSMVPTVHVGDLVVAEVGHPDRLRAGELATFRDPTTHRLVTHRVQSIQQRGPLFDVITRGDANPVGENWSVTATGTVGRVVLRIPRIGYAVGVLGTPAGAIGLAVLGLLLGAWVLYVIWRPRATAQDAVPSGTGSSHRAPSPSRRRGVRTARAPG